MSADGETTSETRAQILEEHRLIAELTARLNATGDLDQLSSGLEQLQPLLASHFAREEARDGIHRTLQRQAPHHARAIQQLEEDHRVLQMQVAELRDQVVELRRGPMREIRAKRAALFQHLREHEASENEVFFDAVWTDLGQGD